MDYEKMDFKRKKGRRAKSEEPRSLKSPCLTLVQNSEPQKIIDTEEYMIHELSALGLHMPQPETKHIKVFPEGWLNFEVFKPCDIRLNGKLFEYRTIAGFKPSAGYLLERRSDGLWVAWEFNGILEYATEGKVYI